MKSVGKITVLHCILIKNSRIHPYFYMFCIICRHIEKCPSICSTSIQDSVIPSKPCKFIYSCQDLHIGWRTVGFLLKKCFIFRCNHFQAVKIPKEILSCRFYGFRDQKNFQIIASIKGAWCNFHRSLLDPKCGPVGLINPHQTIGDISLCKNLLILRSILIDIAAVLCI